MTELSAAGRRYVEQHAAARDALAGAGLPWLGALRRDAIERFSAVGLPTTRVEDWKYTNLRALEKLAFAPAARARNGIGAGALPALLAGERCHRLVFVDGRHRPDLSSPGTLPEGATLASLAGLLEDEPARLEGRIGRVGVLDGQPFLALNAAFAEDGYVLELAPGVALARPVEVVFVATGGAAPALLQPRNLIVAGAGSRATVVERHMAVGAGAYFANVATEIEADDGATLRHYKLQDESASAFHIAHVGVRLAAEAAYENFSLTVGGRLSRNELRVRLAGAGGRCVLDGAYLVDGRRHADTTTVIDHAAPRTTSREVYKGVLDDAARAVFQGRIVVREGAVKTDGHQLNRALLLSESAEIASKPELEIFADDVKCSHGATAGEIDEDALFYLRSRGIPEETARGVLVEAFLDDVVEQIADEPVREAFKRVIGERLHGAGGEER